MGVGAAVGVAVVGSSWAALGEIEDEVDEADDEGVGEASRSGPSSPHPARTSATAATKTDERTMADQR